MCSRRVWAYGEITHVWIDRHVQIKHAESLNAFDKCRGVTGSINPRKTKDLCRFYEHQPERLIEKKNNIVIHWNFFHKGTKLECFSYSRAWYESRFFGLDSARRNDSCQTWPQRPLYEGHRSTLLPTVYWEYHLETAKNHPG